MRTTRAIVRAFVCFSGGHCWMPDPIARQGMASAGCVQPIVIRAGWKRLQAFSPFVTARVSTPPSPPGVLRPPAPLRAMITIVLPGPSVGFSSQRKLSRNLRLIRLRTTALPIWRETARPEPRRRLIGKHRQVNDEVRGLKPHAGAPDAQKIARRRRRYSVPKPASGRHSTRAVWAGSKPSGDGDPWCAAV